MEKTVAVIGAIGVAVKSAILVAEYLVRQGHI